MPQSPPPVAVVTGSSSGIGRATAMELARSGYCLVLHARRNLSGLQQTAQEISQLSLRGRGGVLCLTGDIACQRTCDELVTSAFGWLGRVDAWVNNAGADVLTAAAAEQSFETRLRQLMDVDVLGTIRLSRAVALSMQQQPPRMSNSPNAQTDSSAGPSSPLLPTIINMSWDQATLGMEGEPGQLFGTTKGAVAAFTSSLALSFPRIRINGIAPGWIRTQWGQAAASSYWNRRACDESLASRWGTPHDVAQAIGWLVSEPSQFINGQTLSVNGGRRFYPHQ